MNGLGAASIEPMLIPASPWPIWTRAPPGRELRHCATTALGDVEPGAGSSMTMRPLGSPAHPVCAQPPCIPLRPRSHPSAVLRQHVIGRLLGHRWRRMVLAWPEKAGLSGAVLGHPAMNLICVACWIPERGQTKTGASEVVFDKASAWCTLSHT